MASAVGEGRGDAEKESGGEETGRAHGRGEEGRHGEETDLAAHAEGETENENGAWSSMVVGRTKEGSAETAHAPEGRKQPARDGRVSRKEETRRQEGPRRDWGRRKKGWLQRMREPPREGRQQPGQQLRAGSYSSW